MRFDTQSGDLVKRKHAVLLLVLTAFFWSLGGLMIKKVDLHPMAIAGWRSAIAAIFLLAWNRKRFLWSWPLVGGGCAYAVNMFSFVSATKLTTAANAILLQYTAPAYVAVFGIWFLKEMPRKTDWLAVAFTMAGMVLFFMDKLTFTGSVGQFFRRDCGRFVCRNHPLAAQTQRRQCAGVRDSGQPVDRIDCNTDLDQPDTQSV
jgi:drug/metabolite transporter (DMT)-like permease